MNFSEAIAEVMDVTKRPDKEAEIARAINASISECTIKSSFARDLVETSISIDPTLYGATIQFNNTSPANSIERFRKIKYIKASGVKGYLHPIGAEYLFSPEGFMQKNRYYIGGDNLTYVLSNLASSLEIGYYQYPKILDKVTNKTHWMLEVMPWPILELAAARIFRSIGDDTSFRAYKATGDESFKMHRRDHEDSIMAQAS